MQLHHIDLWTQEERWGEDENRAARRGSKMKSLKKHKSIDFRPQNMMDLRQLAGQRNMADIVRSALFETTGFRIVFDSNSLQRLGAHGAPADSEKQQTPLMTYCELSQLRVMEVIQL